MATAQYAVDGLFWQETEPRCLVLKSDQIIQLHIYTSILSTVIQAVIFIAVFHEQAKAFAASRIVQLSNSKPPSY
jgi:hypothetical protein